MELPRGTGLPPCCPLGPMPAAGGERKPPAPQTMTAAHGQRSSQTCFAAAWATHQGQNPLVEQSIIPGVSEGAGQPAHPGGLGASAVGLGKGRVLRLSLVTKGQHPVVKGAQIVHFLDLELHLHLLSRIESSPCPVFLPGVSPHPREGEQRCSQVSWKLLNSLFHYLNVPGMTLTVSTTLTGERYRGCATMR